MNANKLVWDNEEIELQKDGAYLYMFSRSEFESEYGMSPESYNKEQEAKGTALRTKIHTWSTTVERY